MRTLARALVVLALATCSFALTACPPVVNPPPGPPAVNLDAACSTASQAIAVRQVGDLAFKADHGGTQCVPQSTKCSDATSCGVLVGNVAAGSEERVNVTVSNFGPGFVDITSVDVQSDNDGWYVEGQPPTALQGNQSATIALVLRPTTTGACDAKLVVQSDAGNEPADGVALELHANCTGTAATCAVDNACCCESGATTDPPTCTGNRVTCASGFVAFDDACTQSGVCAP